MRFRYIDERQLALDCAVEEATETAIIQGIKQGIRQGIKQGIKRGMKQGAKCSLLKTAKNMLAKGYSVADIIDITSLPHKQIKTLM
jgi:predicted transposase YdaD